MKYEKMDSIEKADFLLRKYETHKAERVNWDTNWQELAEYFVPNKDDVYGFRMSGEQKGNRLYDSTSVLAVENLAASLHGMMTNPSSVWFALSTGEDELDSDEDVAKYLEGCTRVIINVLNKSNFQQEIHETYIDLGGIGTTVLDIEEDDDTVVRFRSSSIYESYIAENSKGVVDTLFRMRRMSLRNIRQEFGPRVFEENSDLDNKLKKHPEDKEEVIFGIFPECDKDGKETGRYTGSYVLKCKKYLLKETKYHSWPHAVPRWTKLNSEVYGRSPSMKCLPDVRMLNAIMKTTIRGMQKSIDPPLMVPDNGFLLPINTTPNGTNYYRAGSKDRIEPFPVSARPDIGIDFINNIRERIREAFYADQLQLIRQRDMTAEEVMTRNDQSFRFMGPIIGRLSNELLKPTIDRTFDICRRRGLLPKPPAILKNNRDLRIIYTSQIAKVQRTGEASTLIKVLQASGPIIQAQPQVMDNFDGDNIILHNSRLFGLPTSFLVPKKTVKAVRENRAKAQQAQMQAEQDNVEADTQQMRAKASATQT